LNHKNDLHGRKKKWQTAKVSLFSFSGFYVRSGGSRNNSAPKTTRTGKKVEKLQRADTRSHVCGFEAKRLSAYVFSLILSVCLLSQQDKAFVMNFF